MKNLLNLTNFTRNDLQQLLEVATQMRRIAVADYKKGPQLMGQMVCGVWKTPCLSSTAFQLASAYLSGNFCPVFGIDDEYAQCLTFDNMGANVLVVRSDNDNMLRNLAEQTRAGVINGGSAQFDPIGVLADLMTLRVKLDGLNNLNVLAVGNRDVNKIAELNGCLQLFGSDLIWYLPPDDITTVRRGIVLDNISAAFAGADAVVDIGLSSYSSAEKYYGSAAGIPRELLGKAALNCPLLGCGTFVDQVVKEYPHNAISLRESCYVAVAMAVLYYLQRS